MKYIITVKFPSGAVWDFSTFKNQFALVQVKDGMVRSALAFDSAQDAQRHLDKQLEIAPDLDKMAPFAIQCVDVGQ